jgi:hypothetical protein
VLLDTSVVVLLTANVQLQSRLPYQNLPRWKLRNTRKHSPAYECQHSAIHELFLFFLLLLEFFMMELNRYNWRLSQIKEEIESLDLSLGMDEELRQFNNLRLDGPDVPNSPTGYKSDGSISPIYCSTDQVLKKEEVMSEEEIANASIKKIKDKYDSLERMQKHMGKKPLGPPPMDNGLDYESLPPPPVLSLDLPELERLEVPPPQSPTMAPSPQAEASLQAAVFQQFEAAQAEQAEAEIETVTDDDIMQVEMFYRSHRSSVYVCPGLANLYFGTAKQNGSGDNWQLYRTGIPVMVVDSGEARRTRKAHLILAEKGSGFILWKDNLDHLSHFRAVHPNFHTMFLSTDHTKLAGFSYDDVGASNDFLSSLQNVMSDPSDELFNMSKKKKKKEKKQKQKYKAPKKTDISQPCCFMHVTKLERSDRENYGSLAPPVNTDTVDRGKNYVTMRTTPK